MIDVFLMHDHTEQLNGINYYYLKACFLPTDVSGIPLFFLLERLSEGEVANFFNIPTYAPGKIAAGTRIYSPVAGYFEFTENVYKCFAFDLVLMQNDVSNGFAPNVPFVVYCNVSVSLETPLEDLPDNGAREALTACRESEQTLYVPPGFSPFDVTGASRFNDFPFWTRYIPSHAWIYSGCSADSGVLWGLLNYSWEVEFVTQQTAEEGMLILRHDSHALDVHSCRQEFGPWPIWYEQDGDFGATFATTYIANEPAFMFPVPMVRETPQIPHRRRRYISVLNGMLDDYRHGIPGFPSPWNYSFSINLDLQDETGVRLQDEIQEVITQ